MREEQAIFNLEIKKKSGLSINPDIHHSKVFSSGLICLKYLLGTLENHSNILLACFWETKLSGSNLQPNVRVNGAPGVTMIVYNRHRWVLKLVVYEIIILNYNLKFKAKTDTSLILNDS